MKTAIVTGASKGIGRAAAIALADDGWWVLASGLSEDDGARLEKELKTRSGGVFHPADLTNDDTPQALVNRAVVFSTEAT